MRSLIFKRMFDLGAVILTVPLWLPILVIIALVVRLKLGVPVLFRQARPGYRTEIFTLMKFRTMRNECDAQGRWLPDEKRLTRLGQWLRSTSLDELPELINVLRGEMSLVGPRPLLVEYLGRYTSEQLRRHEVPPGLTGWCQVNGRNALTWEQKFSLDLWYVENHGLYLDMKILFLTVGHVFARRGISALDHATMPEFRAEDHGEVRSKNGASSDRSSAGR